MTEESIDGKETAGVTRGQNVLYVLPHDRSTAAIVLDPLLERVDPSLAETQLLAVTADAEGAAWLTSTTARHPRGITAVPATSVRRAERLLRTAPAHLVAGPPAELLKLVQGSSLKLSSVRILVLLSADHLVEIGDDAALESLLAEVPKNAARVVVTAETTPGVEALVERYARRPRRVAPDVSSDAEPLALSYATVSEASRPGALRRLLDEMDPASGFVFVRDESSARAVEEILRSLGYAGASAAIRVRRSGESATGDADVLVLFDVPSSRAELAAAAAGVHRIVALAQPRQLGALRALSQGGAVSPLTFPDAARRVRGRDAQLRDELRRVLQKGPVPREMLAIEPLLDEWDGIEIAAAALQLLEQARAAVPTGPVAATSAMAKLFINVGTRDEVRPGDIVGALTSQGGLTGAQVGRVELRESHSLVEVDAGSAEQVALRLAGKEIRGRRVQARVDRGAAERPPREGRPDRPRGDRPTQRGDRDERPRPGGPRDRPGFDRGESRGRPPRAGADRPRPSTARPRRSDG